MTKRICMWSGPRNISTAMMRSWENRQDCEVVDEPFYAYYLHQTKSPHPMFEQILSSQSSVYNEVANRLCTGDCTTELQYQKHMTHHMLEGCDLSWTKALQHCFLIRDPAFVVNSYTNSRGTCSVEAIGIIRQYELYNQISELTGNANIPVVDSADVLSQPLETLSKFCQHLEVGFDHGMLSWPAGERASDGVWAEHWYKSVRASTGFSPSVSQAFSLTKAQQDIVDEVMPFYAILKAKAL
ncbi:HAD family hydrolase [Ningiella sp. W23]|uniref:sulfotransferase-like domain-containing protein n=1 Tax=Ningiella sp. W23 TaxID=3023715 RepID=UPI0037565607